MLFNSSFLCDGGFDVKGIYLFAEYPHGTLPLGPVLGGLSFPIYSNRVCIISFFININSLLIIFMPQLHKVHYVFHYGNIFIYG